MNQNTILSGGQRRSNYTLSIAIIGALFFIFGFVTWLNGSLIPYLRIACELNNFEAYLVTFAFYISYFVMAIPSSWVLKRTGFKRGMMVGLLVMSLGAVFFIPAALTRTYYLFLTGLFIIGTGLSILQTASNPYITILGPIESAARRISIMGICNKVAGAISPLILGAIILKNADEITISLQTMNGVQRDTVLDALAQRVIVPYIIIALVLLFLAMMVRFSSLPEIDTEQELQNPYGSGTSKKNVFQFPQLVFGVIALFFYVGAEVIAADTIIPYGKSWGIPMDTAKTFTTLTLLAMIVGYLIGIFTIPKYLRQEKALQISAVVGLLFTLAALLTHGMASVACIATLGLANAIMWPAIWPLALEGLGRFTKIGSALLIMSIAGGALLPLIYGKLVDEFDAQKGYWLLIPCYLIIWYYATAGHRKRVFWN
ncbi:MAG: sugar MFS transporter [Chitinophagales bacterium]|nr:sugar MFS transporter [Chitinophagales bacterium]